LRDAQERPLVHGNQLAIADEVTRITQCCDA